MFNPADLILMLPELYLLAAVCILLLLDLYVTPERRDITHYAAIFVALATAVVIFLPHGIETGTTRTAFGGMYIRDAIGDVLKLAMLGVTMAVFCFSRLYLRERGLWQGEFYALCLFALLGMMLLVSAGNLLTVYLGLELLALSSYALVALNRDSKLSSEAAMKYFVLGALASGLLLYGMSMIYGATGSLDLATIQAVAAAPGKSETLLTFGLVFLVVGLAFKFGAAPFHMWIPDVYQGAPTAVTLFIASVPKLAAFGMAYRLLEGGLAGLDVHWREMLALLAVLSLAIGNIVAIAQTNLKRMLAYSTISHVGFLLLGLVNAGPSGYAAAMFYALSYSIMAAGAFGMILLMSRKGHEAENIEDFRGLNRRDPWHAFMMLLFLGSLAGFPPLLGFYAKLMVLKAAIDAGMLWLAIVGVVFAVIGAYYYLYVIKVMYFDAPADESELLPTADLQFRVLLSANGLAQLALGVFWGPLLGLCLQAFGV